MVTVTDPTSVVPGPSCSMATAKEVDLGSAFSGGYVNVDVLDPSGSAPTWSIDIAPHVPTDASPVPVRLASTVTRTEVTEVQSGWVKDHRPTARSSGESERSASPPASVSDGLTDVSEGDVPKLRGSRSSPRRVAVKVACTSLFAETPTDDQADQRVTPAASTVRTRIRYVPAVTARPFASRPSHVVVTLPFCTRPCGSERIAVVDVFGYTKTVVTALPPCVKVIDEVSRYPSAAGKTVVALIDATATPRTLTVTGTVTVRVPAADVAATAIA